MGADLMIEYGVGVSHHTLRVPKIDSNYFTREMIIHPNHHQKNDHGRRVRTSLHANQKKS